MAKQNNIYIIEVVWYTTEVVKNHPDDTEYEEERIENRKAHTIVASNKKDAESSIRQGYVTKNIPIYKMYTSRLKF